jgi:SAM-dependent methyltransferase
MIDIFGLAIEDFHNGTKDGIIQVDTNLTEGEELSVPYLFRTEETIPEWEQIALDKAHGSVLDVGACAGCHTNILRDRGLDVHPIDISPLAMSHLKKQGHPARAINFFDLKDENYDTILLLMNGLGLMEKVDRLPDFLKQAKSLLNKGGQILLESSDIIYMFEEEDGSYLVDINGDYYGEMEYTLSYKEQTAEPFPWLYLSFDLLKDAAEAEGFKVELLYQDQQDGNYLASCSI